MGEQPSWLQEVTINISQSDMWKPGEQAGFAVAQKIDCSFWSTCFENNNWHEWFTVSMEKWNLCEILFALLREQKFTGQLDHYCKRNFFTCWTPHPVDYFITYRCHNQVMFQWHQAIGAAKRNLPEGMLPNVLALADDIGMTLQGGISD